MSERNVCIDVAYTNKKQSAYGTGVGDADLTEAHPFIGDDNVEVVTEKYDDREEFGKGHEFPTQQHNLVADTRLKRSFEASSRMLAWALAFLAGDITTTQPDGTGAPNTYQHVIKPMDIDDSGVGKQLPVTTIVEALTSFRKRKFRDMLVKSVTLKGELKKQLQLELELVGSGHYEDSTLSMPTPASSSFLRMADVTFTIGSDDVSAKLISFEFKHDNELAEDLGYHPGSGYLDATSGAPQIRGKLEVTKRGVTLKARVLMEAETLDGYQKANTEKAITIVAEGATIESTYKHKLTLEMPVSWLKATPIAREGNLMVYDIEFNVGWSESDSAPWKATIINDVASYLAAAS